MISSSELSVGRSGVRCVEGALEQILSLDPGCLAVDERLDLLVSLDRLMSRASARMERMLDSLADPHDEGRHPGEIRCVLRWSDGYTRARVAQATKLARGLPQALQRHEAGELNSAQARAVAQACQPLERQGCDQVLDRVLPRAGSQTVTEFENCLTRAVHRADPRTAEDRHATAKRARGGVAAGVAGRDGRDLVGP